MYIYIYTYIYMYIYILYVCVYIYIYICTYIGSAPQAEGAGIQRGSNEIRVSQCLLRSLQSLQYSEYMRSTHNHRMYALRRQGRLAFASPTSAWALGIHHEACIGIARCFCRCQEHVCPERNVLVLGVCGGSMDRYHADELSGPTELQSLKFIGCRPLNTLLSNLNHSAVQKSRSTIQDLLAMMAASIKQPSL